MAEHRPNWMSGSIVLCTRLACAGPPLTNVANCKTPDVALKTLQQDAAARPECYSVGLGKSACSAVSRSQRTLLSYQPEKIAPSFSLMALTTVHVTRAYSFDPQALRGPCRQQLAISRISVKAALIVKMYNRIGPHISRNDHRQPDVYSTIGPAAVSELCCVCLLPYATSNTPCTPPFDPPPLLRQHHRVLHHFFL
ncbi:hypothetical protein CPB86DRAFT_152469 [Serendipita vermifera]|nr:hypothetical protein CPB86DRAFT_152469 [Serendipita vermifera]